MVGSNDFYNDNLLFRVIMLLVSKSYRIYRWMNLNADNECLTRMLIFRHQLLLICHCFVNEVLITLILHWDLLYDKSLILVYAFEKKVKKGSSIILFVFLLIEIIPPRMVEWKREYDTWPLLNLNISLMERVFCLSPEGWALCFSQRGSDRNIRRDF